MEMTVERMNLNMPPKYCLYSGMRNPSAQDEIAWQEYDTYKTKAQAITAMRKKHAEGFTGLWMIVQETVIAAMLPAVQEEDA